MSEKIWSLGFTQNRELSWLQFNARVLEEAEDETVPLLERLKGIMLNIFHMADNAARECDRPGDLVTGANVAGFAKVAKAMLSEGLY